MKSKKEKKTVKKIKLNKPTKLVALFLFVAVMIASLGGGIYSLKNASDEKVIYTENTKQIDRINGSQEEGKTDNPILNSAINAVNTLQKSTLPKYQKAATNAKLAMKKWGTFSAIFMFVAFAMLICSIVMFTSIRRMTTVKVVDPDDEDDDEDDKTDDKKREKKKSDFDIILEAPKPSISEEE